MHFLRRQYWHRFLFTLWMAHCWFFVHGRYWIFCWIDRRKNPFPPNSSHFSPKPSLVCCHRQDLVLTLRPDRPQGGLITSPSWHVAALS